MSLPSLPQRLCKLMGPWLCRHLLWWVAEKRESRERTARALSLSEDDRETVARKLNLIELSMRTHVPMRELERLDDAGRR